MNCEFHSTWRRRPELTWWGAPLLVLAFLCAGCWQSDCTGPGVTEPVGWVTDIVGCKGAGELLRGDVPPNQDCIEYRYSRRTLRIKHINTAFNCCPEIEAYATVCRDTIFITEQEPPGGCHCLCLYDLTYDVIHLPPGEYRVIVSQQYLLQGDEPLEFTVDLRESPSGSYCVTRNHYPWGRKSQG